MNQRTFGSTSLKVSELCLGTMNFGWRTDASASLAILDAYHAGGGNYLQAAGTAVGSPSSQVSPTFSETIVGYWWTSRRIPRANLVLATRMSTRDPDGSEPTHLADAVRKSCEASLRRLRTDYLDLLVCEWTGAGRPPEALRRGLDWLVHEGLVRYIAFANLPAWQLVTSLRESAQRGHCRIDAVQGDYSMLTRTAFERDLDELCREQRLGFLARSPLAGGLLARRSGRSDALGRSRRAWLAERHGWDAGERATRVLCALAEGAGCSPAQFALSWVLHHPRVTSLLMGLVSLRHLDDALKAAEIRLRPDELRQLHEATCVQRVVLPMRPADALWAGERALAS